MDERTKFIGRLLGGEKMAPLSRKFGITRRTGYKIWERSQQDGNRGRYNKNTPELICDRIENMNKSHLFFFRVVVFCIFSSISKQGISENFHREDYRKERRSNNTSVTTVACRGKVQVFQNKSSSIGKFESHLDPAILPRTWEEGFGAYSDELCAGFSEALDPPIAELLKEIERRPNLPPLLVTMRIEEGNNPCDRKKTIQRIALDCSQGEHGSFKNASDRDWAKRKNLCKTNVKKGAAPADNQYLPPVPEPSGLGGGTNLSPNIDPGFSIEAEPLPGKPIPR